MSNKLTKTIAYNALAVGLIASTGLAVVSPTQAANIALTIDNTTGDPLNNPPFTLGFQFTANQNINVNQLGFFDSEQDGLIDNHDIGLWDNNGNLLASATITSGNSAPLINQFRYVNISPVLLNAGNIYRIGALYLTGSDAVVFNATNLLTDPAITFNERTYQGGGSLSDPVNSFGNDGFFGPNFTFESQSVPEPTSTLGFITLGIVGAGSTLKHKRKQK